MPLITTLAAVTEPQEERVMTVSVTFAQVFCALTVVVNAVAEI